jgi:hypothetical protein
MKKRYLADEPSNGRVAVAPTIISTGVLNCSFLNPRRDQDRGDTEMYAIGMYFFFSECLSNGDAPDSKSSKIKGIVLAISSSFGIGQAVRIRDTNGRRDVVSKAL